ncbi:MAG TPA: recombinase family protein [Pseudomonadota bacterium]|nr:recombinase family protein [Pseudomonadota bacterium]
MRHHSERNVMGTPGRTAVGYIRVSTDMQAADGLSLSAQRAAIKSYCESVGLRLLQIHEDVESGGRADRKGLARALATKADVVVVLKFDRLSRSIKHFCDLYETHFADGTKELVAIREAIRLDSALGRALVSILLVFAQMEREACGERVKEAIGHIRGNGYHFGKAPYGSKAVPSPDNPRYRILVDDPEEQRILSRIKSMIEARVSYQKIATQLNAEQVPPPQGASWTVSVIYNLNIRKGWHVCNTVNERPHSDEEVRLKMHELRDRGTTYQGIANILNELGYVPYKGRKFTESSVFRLMARTRETQILTPRKYCESLTLRMGHRPSYPQLAKLLSEAGFLTPKGNSHWWPAQVRELLLGRYDQFYAKRKPAQERPEHVE